MARALVTCLAQKRRPQFKQRRLRRAVRIVTVGAVLGDRLMFPEKRPAIFGVTGRAGFIDGVFNQLRRGRRTVRRVARGAGHRAFAQRMMRRLQKIAVLRLMTGGCRLRPGSLSPAPDPWPRAACGSWRRPHRSRHARSMPSHALRSTHGRPDTGHSGAAVEVCDLRPKTMILDGSPPSSTCAAPGPWQASHCSPPCPKGPRGSFGRACLV